MQRLSILIRRVRSYAAVVTRRCRSIAIRRGSQLLRDGQTANHELADFEPPHAGAADHQPPDRESAKGQSSNRDAGKCQRAKGLCSDDADR